jgi:hypothetical protein
MGKRRRSKKKVKGRGTGKKLALAAGTVGLAALAAHQGRQHLTNLRRLQKQNQYLLQIIRSGQHESEQRYQTARTHAQHFG